MAQSSLVIFRQGDQISLNTLAYASLRVVVVMANLSATFFENAISGPIYKNAKSWVKKEIGLTDWQIQHLPTRILNIPSYANWTDEGWRLHVHGNVYKQPHLTDEKLNTLANKFLIRASTTLQKGHRKHFYRLTPEEAAQARNLIAEIMVVPTDGAEVYMHIEGHENITLPWKTSSTGDFDAWLPLSKHEPRSLVDGYLTDKLQTLDISAHVYGSDAGVDGNATSYLVPPHGFTLISDVDDILRVAEIWNPKQMLLNTFARPYTPWLNMPDLYREWARTVPNVHFHYLTVTPEPDTRWYIHGTSKHPGTRNSASINAAWTQHIDAPPSYPPGSFDTRPMDFTTLASTTHARLAMLERYFQTFPQRKIILIGDTSNKDVMRDYPGLALKYAEQVQCIWIRNTAVTDATDNLVWTTRPYALLPPSKYMFFNHPLDLTDLLLPDGSLTCVNSSVHQLPLSPSSSSSSFSHPSSPSSPLPSSSSPNTPSSPSSRHRSAALPGLDAAASAARGAWWALKCVFAAHRPSAKCPFDRRPGTAFADGSAEASEGGVR
ncbi:hypothetical protein B0A49_07928 [Cryomyces minteri]|uniref:Phosphatidate phosphatase APP1 catalytic domain-containing protein n=1 Tax=Cryomyces minteri TaxID=331657 RepID=A0A4U0WYT6_9PEZI|nr:hypothetical protein B0A49_07928 [Cryomyces minteri]